MLTIKGIHKLLGEGFIDYRFLFTNFEETPTHLRFWFKDVFTNKSGIGVWVEIEREGEFDVEEDEVLYRVSYPHCGPHLIGVEWFCNIDNAKWTFEQALKEQ